MEFHAIILDRFYGRDSYYFHAYKGAKTYYLHADGKWESNLGGNSTPFIFNSRRHAIQVLKRTNNQYKFTEY